MKTNILAEKNSLVSDLETRLSSASEENFTLSAKIKDALSGRNDYREWKGLLLKDGARKGGCSRIESNRRKWRAIMSKLKWLGRLIAYR